MEKKELTKTPFVYIGKGQVDDGLGGFEETGDRYQAQFPMIDDGCPGSDTFFSVVIEIVGDNKAVGNIAIISSNGVNVWPLGEFECDSIEALTRALYGAARLVTIKTFEPKM